MSKISKIVSAVAGIVGTALVIVGLLTGQPSLVLAGTILQAVGAVAGAVALATARPPPARGSVNQVLIGRNLPVPYGMGRTYIGGIQAYDNSAGEDNKDRTHINVLTAAGPVESIDYLFADYSPIGLDEAPANRISGEATGYYKDYLWVDSRLGLRPDTALLNDPGRAPLREWDSTHKLSGFAAYRVTMRFDKDGKRFASGVPQWGCVFKGVKVYDPRKDSTYPGGSGTHRFNDEATFTYGSGYTPEGENPAIHALTYARGRFIEKTASGAAQVPPVKVCGCGFDATEIELAQFVELANLCDANGWKVGGVIYEAPGSSKWDNLKRILAAAAAEPVWSGGKLGVKISAPRTPVVTIGLPDLSEGDASVQAMQSWRDKVNTIVPRIRLEQQRWEYTQLTEVTSATYLTEDGGETKTEEVQFDLVQDVNQGAHLAAYRLTNGREFGPVQLSLKPAFMVFKLGEAVTLNIPELGLTNQLAVITGRQVDPATGGVLFSFISETTAKHSFALGQVGVAPPTPTLVPPQEMDETTGDQNVSIASVTTLIANSSTTNLTATAAVGGAVTVSTHQRVYADKTVTVTGATIAAPAGTVAGDTVAIWYDDPDRVGGAVVYQNARLPGGSGQIDSYYASAAHPYRHFVVAMPIPTSGTSTGGSGVGPGTGGTGGGSTGGGGGWQLPTPEP